MLFAMPPKVKKPLGALLLRINRLDNFLKKYIFAYNC